MTGDVNMNSKRIHNLPNPNNSDQPVNLEFASKNFYIWMEDQQCIKT